MFPAARWARVAAVVVLTAGATAVPTARAGETEAKTSDAARAARVGLERAAGAAAQVLRRGDVLEQLHDLLSPQSRVRLAESDQI